MISFQKIPTLLVAITELLAGNHLSHLGGIIPVSSSSYGCSNWHGSSLVTEGILGKGTLTIPKSVRAQHSLTQRNFFQGGYVTKSYPIS